MDRFTAMSAQQIARAIRDGQTTSLAVTRAFIDQIEAVNPAINAVVVKCYDKALQDAKKADEMVKSRAPLGPLHGVPMTIKECLDLPGTPSTTGLLRRKNDIPTDTDPYVQRILDAGAIIIAKTNVPQLMAYYECNNPVYGVTNHPHDPDFSPGGSSGGEGAIIAAGGSILGLGTDIGGSIRIPSAFCGIVGIKPTMWRTYDFTRVGDPPPALSINAVTGPMGKYVEDLAIVLSLISDVPSPVQTKPRELKDWKKVEVKKLKIGYYLDDGLFEPAKSVQQAVLKAARILMDSGIEIKEIRPFKAPKAEELFYKILVSDKAKVFTNNLQGDKPTRQIRGALMLARASKFKRSILKGLTALTGQKSMQRHIDYFGVNGPDALRKLEIEQAEYRDEYLAMMQRNGNLDIILSPVCPVPAYRHGDAEHLGIGGTYALLNNLLGFPAGVVPVSRVAKEEIVPRNTNSDMLLKRTALIEANSEGLPVAVQIAAKPWREDQVLALMKYLQDHVNLNEG